MKTNSWLVLTMTVLCFLSANAQVSLPALTAGPVAVETDEKVSVPAIVEFWLDSPPLPLQG